VARSQKIGSKTPLPAACLADLAGCAGGAGCQPGS
jgi:hypothetical protein